MSRCDIELQMLREALAALNPHHPLVTGEYPSATLERLQAYVSEVERRYAASGYDASLEGTAETRQTLSAQFGVHWG